MASTGTNYNLNRIWNRLKNKSSAILLDNKAKALANPDLSSIAINGCSLKEVQYLERRLRLRLNPGLNWNSCISSIARNNCWYWRRKTKIEQNKFYIFININTCNHFFFQLARTIASTRWEWIQLKNNLIGNVLQFLLTVNLKHLQILCLLVIVC